MYLSFNWKSKKKYSILDYNNNVSDWGISEMIDLLHYKKSLLIVLTLNQNYIFEGVIIQVSPPLIPCARVCVFVCVYLRFTFCEIFSWKKMNRWGPFKPLKHTFLQWKLSFESDYLLDVSFMCVCVFVSFKTLEKLSPSFD